jgi:hypothetical protein
MKADAFWSPLWFDELIYPALASQEQDYEVIKFFWIPAFAGMTIC